MNPLEFYCTKLSYQIDFSLVLFGLLEKFQMRVLMDMSNAYFWVFLALQEEMEKNRKVSTGIYHFFAGNAILIWQWNLISNLGSIFVAKKNNTYLNSKYFSLMDRNVIYTL